MEGREGQGQHVRLQSKDSEVSSPLKPVMLNQTHLRMEEELWSIRQMEVPYSYQPIRVVDSFWVLVVSRCAQLGKLRVMVGSVLRPIAQ